MERPRYAQFLPESPVSRVHRLTHPYKRQHGVLRISVATAGNDHRLGANEAPPAVVSIFLGDELNAVLEAIENNTPYEGIEKTQMKLGADVLPKFNRTASAEVR